LIRIITVKINSDKYSTDDDTTYLNFFFSSEKIDELRIKINNYEKKIDSKSAELLFNPEELLGSIGANLKGQYNMKLSLNRLVLNKIHSVNPVSDSAENIIGREIKISNIFNIDANNKESIYVDKENRVGKIKNSNPFKTDK
jgi:hypothetical protein